MSRRRWAVGALAAALVALSAPASGVAALQLSEGGELADFDARTGRLAPSQAQRKFATAHRLKVTWNQFGTPASVAKRGTWVATGVRGSTAVAAARNWLAANRALFRVSASDLVLDADTRLAFGKGHAVNFRQVFDGLATSESGLVTVGIVRGTRYWRVAYASSSLTRNTTVAGEAGLSGAQAWVYAAQSVGLKVNLMGIDQRKTANGWRALGVDGLDEEQRVRLVAFPRPLAGVVPAYESLVLKTEDGFAYRIYVDARNGAVLARNSLVDNAAQTTQAVQTFTFSGTLAATNGACGPMHGPYAVGAGVRALDGFAAATVPTNDLVLNLFRNGTLVLSADTLFSPEQFHYEPAGGVPTGDYTVQVCDFAGDGGWAAPTTYTGTFTIDDTPPPPAYLARWENFPSSPPLNPLPADPWGNSSTDTRETWCWQDGNAGDCDRVIGNLASRGPWDHDHKLNTPTFTTRGNNAKSATSWTNDLLPSPPQYMPTSPQRDYRYPWTNVWYTSDCGAPAGAPGATWDDAAATVNLFVVHNRMHDWTYYLGFTERNWNAQDYNFGLTERRQENDPLFGDVQAGAVIAGVRDNANMITQPDGVSSITNMYLWQPIQAAFYAPCVDGDYDAGVIGHEYGHMVENRMIGKGNIRTGHHAGAMGESNGDMMAMEIANEYGFFPHDGENRYSVGYYATGNKIRAIRNYGMNFPSYGAVPEPGEQLYVNSLNFSDMGYDVVGPQVHADGEIWSATNFGIRKLLIEKYNRSYPVWDRELQTECANGETPPQRCPGNRRWIQLVFDAYLLMPTNPSMLQARDAMLAADLMRFGGANQDEIWLGFAKRGFGAGATSSNTTANTDTDPTPDFKPVGTKSATVTFEAKSGHTTITTARIFVGHYEGRVSPIADTNPATTGQNLDEVAEFAPGTYEFVANAPGYGHVRFRETFKGGHSEKVRIQFSENLASLTNGATATGDGTTLNNLIDDQEATNWAAEGTITGGNLSVDGRKVTVDLAGTKAEKIRRVQVSAMLNPGQNRFTALRQFEIWTCNAAAGQDCASDAGYSLRYTSVADAFPAAVPRPTATDLILREFDVPDTNATHVRLVVKTSQCTGGPAYQGDQDADPANNADCDSNVPTNAAWRFVRAAELQVFGDK